MRELASTVRSASPLLISLIEQEGLTLDDVSTMIVAAPGWPNRPRLFRAARGLDLHAHELRHVAATGKPYVRPAMLHGFGLVLSGGGWVAVRILGHSLEILTTMGPLTFETRFGELLVTVRGGLPLALAAGAVGRPLDDFVLHPATSGRGWHVDAVHAKSPDATLVVVTGSVPLTLG